MKRTSLSVSRLTKDCEVVINGEISENENRELTLASMVELGKD